MISKYYEKKIQSLPWALYLSQLIIGRGTFPGGQVQFLGDFGVLVYCTPALLSVDVAQPLH